MIDSLRVAAAELVAALRQFDQWACVGHVSPDADTLGATLGLARSWRQHTGSRVTAVVGDGRVSNRLQFLLDCAEVEVATAADVDAADGFAAVDVAQVTRLNWPTGIDGAWSGRPMVNIDHHVSNTRFGTVNWVADHATSTCEMIFHFLRAAAAPVDAVTASLLYAGLYTDTVGFSLPTVTRDTFTAAADLLDCGADVGGIAERLARSLADPEFALLRTIYRNTRLAADGKIAYSTASFDEVNAAGCGPADIDDQVVVPRSRAGISIAILFTEAVRNRTRLNFRGEGATSVLPLARQFNGGGHATAAGATLDCPVDEAVARVLPAAIAQIEADASPTGPDAHGVRSGHGCLEP